MNLSKLGKHICQMLFEARHVPSSLNTDSYTNDEKRVLKSTLRYAWVFYALMAKSLHKICHKTYLRPHLCSLMCILELKLYAQKPNYYLSKLWQSYLRKHKISWLYSPTWAFISKIVLPLEQYRQDVLNCQEPGTFLLKALLQQESSLSLDKLLSHPPLWCLLHQQDSALKDLVESLAITRSPLKLPSYLLKGTLVDKNDYFAKGMISYQDLSSLAVYDLANQLEGFSPTNIIDTCASPGGKTSLLAKLWPQSGILATDLTLKKVHALENNMNRIFRSNHKIVCQQHDWSDKPISHFADLVLVDLPCSGSGVIRKHPDILWNRNREDFNTVLNIQRKILRNAYLALNCFGYMIVATCSVLTEENDQQILHLIEGLTKSDEKLVVVDVNLQIGRKTRFGWQNPIEDWHDGLYYSILRKVPRGTY